ATVGPKCLSAQVTVIEVERMQAGHHLLVVQESFPRFVRSKQRQSHPALPPDQSDQTNQPKPAAGETGGRRLVARRRGWRVHWRVIVAVSPGSNNTHLRSHKPAPCFGQAFRLSIRTLAHTICQLGRIIIPSTRSTD